MSQNDNLQVSFGIQGMERTSHQHLIDEKSYTFARNANLETDVNTLGLTNEHSNLLCSVFKPGYVVIGTKYDQILSRVWFLITQKDSYEKTDTDGNIINVRNSEIGWIDIRVNYEDESDLEMDCGCDMISFLNESLENIQQVPICKYNTFLEDSCNNCLNFDPNYPAHNIVLKQEACGTTLTFATKNNPLRYINLDNPQFYQETGSINCGEDNTEDICLDCDKLRVFPLYNKPYIYPETITYGGNLKRGTYEFYVAYCDKMGNELSPYLAATNQIDLFDMDNIQLNQSNRFSHTSYGIKLKIEGLDLKFNFYKIAVIEKTGENENVSSFIEGIHPINDNIVSYTRNGSDIDNTNNRISINKIFAVKPIYKNFGGITSSNGYLIGYDYEIEKEWNLQPMVNLLGTFVKWQTVEAGEGLYKDGVNISMYKGYMRDEVYPFGIRFLTDSGYKTNVFPLIGRPPLAKDLYEYDEYTNNQDIKSVYENSPNCSTTDRKYHWQFYNTGSVIGNSYSTSPVNNATPVEVNVVEDCIQKGVKILTQGVITIPTTETFYGLRDYVDTHYRDICGEPDSDPEFYNQELCELITDVGGDECENVSELFPFPICEDINDCIDKFCDINSEHYNQNICNNIQQGIGYCDGPILQSTPYLRIGDIMNEVITPKEKRLPNETGTQPVYEHKTSNIKCNQFIANQEKVVNLLYFQYDGGDYFDDFALKNYIERSDSYENNSCDDALPVGITGISFDSTYTGKILTVVFAHNNFQGRVHYIKTEGGSVITTTAPTGPVDFGTDPQDLLTNRPASPVSGFHNFIHKKALWFELDFSQQSEYIVEVTPVNYKKEDGTTLVDDDVRMSIYTKCNANVLPLRTEVYKSNEGIFVRLKKSDFNNVSKIYIALDTKLKPHSFKYNYRGGEGDVYFIEGYLLTTSTVPGCFDVVIRPIEHYQVDVTYDAITMDRVSTYATDCMFNKPSDNDCGVSPHLYGMFSYWESMEEYPDNSDLYDSSTFKLKPEDISGEDLDLKELFEDYFVNNIDENGYYEWKRNNSGKSKANFICEPIRHFKFPDNNVVPFMTTAPITEFSNSNIYPIGITIDEDTIEKFLDAAVISKLITKEQRKSIKGYEIFRGDRVNNRSIIYKGILNDMYEDPYQTTSKQRTFFRNFPYNTLGKNAFLTSDSERTILVDHPYPNSTQNDRFSLIAPEVYNNRVRIPTEMSVDGYIYGSSITTFPEVLDHSEWVLLGEKAYEKAGKLALYEVLLEAALDVATMTIEAGKGLWWVAGVGSTGTGAAGSAVGYGALATYVVSQAINGVFKHAKYKTQWLDIFDTNGNVENFAHMQVSSKGYYNYFRKNSEKGDMLRGISSSRYLNNGLEALTEKEGGAAQVVVINNKDRENSVYLSLGSNFPLKYPNEYLNYDNYSKAPKNASRSLASDNNCNSDINAVKRIASPYVTLKNYVPTQYGKIDEIKWLSVNHNSHFNNESKNIFGGDIFISRVDLKNKFKLFNKNAVGLANRTPFKYSKASNVAYARFYVDHKSAAKEIGANDIPYLGSDYKFDCKGNRKTFYEESPSKFYLFSYGIPYFLVESEINCNFRYVGNEYHEEFASRGVNVEDWVQEKNVSIAHNNYFYYNNVYSRNQSGLPYTILGASYDRSKIDCLADAENGVVWSAQDNSEVSLSDPWLTFKTHDIYRFPFTYGKLISLDPIESTQIMGRFENNMTLFGVVDVLKDRITPENSELSAGGMFDNSRPTQFNNTELGETGSQHRSMVSCEFGHFWTDAKRGKIFQLNTNGAGLVPISDFKKEGGESGMRRWFKKHLPFKILKQGIIGLTEKNIDNHYKGIGILMWWDSKFKRVFISKLDYTVNPTYKGKISFAGGNYFVTENDETIEIELTNKKYFKNVSWTVAYSPMYNSWVSYYDFTPHYTIALNDYFNTGINYTDVSNESEKGMWSHLITNKSYQVFYGKRYPFEIELPIKNTHTNNVLKDIKFWTISHRYHDNNDYAVWRKKSFNKLIVHNQTNNSGLLHLNYDDSMNKSKYPISISQVEQGIQATHFDEQVMVNYYYNRVKNEDNHIPIWNNDVNEIHKTLNSNAISFNSKRVLERLRGDWFLVHLIQDNTSQFKQIFKWLVSRETPY